MTDNILFLDTEVGVYSEKIHNIGVLLGERRLQGSSIAAVKDGIKELKYDFVCGHHFIKHDKKYLELTSLNQIINNAKIIDTLYLSMLLYPNRSTHKLGKPYKTQINIENDPVGDCEQTKELLLLLKTKFESMSDGLQSALYTLLGKHEYFYAFFEAFGFYPKNSVDIFEYFGDNIKCPKEQFLEIQRQNPVELAFVLSWLSSGDKASISKITLLNFPKIRTVVESLTFSIETTDLGDFSKNEFGIDGFRSFSARDSSLFKSNEISQKDIVLSALNKKSLLAILPTGGGKTFTFQLPALIKAKAYKGLTIVISPLQALMKNHVDSFNAKNQNFKVAAISGYLSPIERMNTLEEVRRGIVDILYLAPEALRSNSIFGALSSRMIERFVIDEAHCFSTWGHDFRHDYKYIAAFIKELQNSPFQNAIPVSCFTATAKPDVLEDIKSYFEDK
ncbi:MAG TPA: DEAD/DEAH box helicase, partial [Campylobacterales bacterium]|nr:DEAD/DEAH box helicase [Campylobacterales bacterium]